MSYADIACTIWSIITILQKPLKIRQNSIAIGSILWAMEGKHKTELRRYYGASFSLDLARAPHGREAQWLQQNRDARNLTTELRQQRYNITTATGYQYCLNTAAARQRVIFTVRSVRILSERSSQAFVKASCELCPG